MIHAEYECGYITEKNINKIKKKFKNALVGNISFICNNRFLHSLHESSNINAFWVIHEEYVCGNIAGKNIKPALMG